LPRLKKLYSGVRRISRNNKNPLIYLPREFAEHVGKQVYVVVYEVEDDDGKDGCCEG